MTSDIAPFRKIGNLYFVGCLDASCHLLDTGEGLILLDSGYPEHADMIVESMSALGFSIRDVRYIIHSHGHYDHTRATKRLVELSGAETFLSSKDQRYVDQFPDTAFRPDHDLREGDVIRLGNTEIQCMATPGHTLGTMSFFFTVSEDGKEYRAGTFGGAGVKQLSTEWLNRYGLSTDQRKDYYASLDRLAGERVDVFVGNHAWQDKTAELSARIAGGDRLACVNPEAWGAFLAKCRRQMDKMLQKEKEQ